MDGWIDLKIPPEELRAASTLETGQCFQWKRLAEDEWLGIPHEAVRLRSTLKTTLVKPLQGYLDLPKLMEYLNLGPTAPRLADLMDDWDGLAADAAQLLPGSRVLLQCPNEALISFICSANNNVPRITLTLERLRRRCGRVIGELPSLLGKQMLERSSATHVQECASHGRLHAFPSFQELAALSEEELQSCGLGYRARYVKATAMALAGEPEGIRGLRRWRRQEAEGELRRLPGVGPKVAACVALYGLGFHDAVPVDVHVARVVDLEGPVSLRRHREVAEAFRSRWRHAGWAQHVIFAAQRLRRW